MESFIITYEKNTNKKKILKKLILGIIFIYVSWVFINQQQALNSYETAKEYNENKLEKVKEHQESLMAMKDNINSDEYIERIAREKLDMYLPNEKIYMDISK